MLILQQQQQQQKANKPTSFKVRTLWFLKQTFLRPLLIPLTTEY